MYMYLHAGQLSVELKESKTQIEKGLANLAELKKQQISEVKLIGRIIIMSSTPKQLMLMY